MPFPPDFVNAPQPSGKPQPIEGDARSDLQILIQRWPRCFAFKFKRRRPLKIGIHNDIIAAGLEFSPWRRRRVFRFYLNRPEVQQGYLEGAARIDLDGNCVGVVTAVEAATAKHNIQRFKERQSSRQPKQAAVVSARAAPPAPPPAPPLDATESRWREARLGLAGLKAAALARRSQNNGEALNVSSEQ
jgi:sRNA-binding protein